MKKLIFLLVIWELCIANAALGQNTKYSYNNKYHISLPSKLELQDSELNTISNGNKQQINIKSLANKIVFQQKGLNSEQKAAFSKYCRVIIEYYKEDRNEPAYGRGDQIIVDRDLLYAVHGSVKEACTINKTPLLKFLNIQPLTINGSPVLFYSYRRQGWEGKQPPVIVNVYQIFNRYESVTLTFSYREAERETWKSIHDNIVKSFTFMHKY